MQVARTVADRRMARATGTSLSLMTRVLVRPTALVLALAAGGCTDTLNLKPDPATSPGDAGKTASAAPTAAQIARATTASVVIYTASWCGTCRAAKDYFRDQGIPFEDKAIDSVPEYRKEFDRMKGVGVPLILVNADRMDGFTRHQFDAMLRRATQPEKPPR